MKALHIELGEMVRNYRIKAGLTQLELATMMGYESMQFVSLFERGLSRIPQQGIGQLIELLKIPEKKFTDKMVKEYTINLLLDIKVGKAIIQKKREQMKTKFKETMKRI